MSAMGRQTLRLALGLVLAVSLFPGCATRQGARPAPVETRDDRGFTITEEVDAGLGVRSDFRRALEHLAEKEYEKGIEILESVVEATPDSTTAHINLGIAHRHAEDLSSAEKSLQRALELNPRHPAALNEMGIVYRRTGRFEEARVHYEKALDVYPEFHFARRNLAILCDVFLQDLECAIEHYERFARAVPDDAEAAMWITDLRNRAGKE